MVPVEFEGGWSRRVLGTPFVNVWQGRCRIVLLVGLDGTLTRRRSTKAKVELEGIEGKTGTGSSRRCWYCLLLLVGIKKVVKLVNQEKQREAFLDLARIFRSASSVASGLSIYCTVLYSIGGVKKL